MFLVSFGLLCEQLPLQIYQTVKDESSSGAVEGETYGTSPEALSRIGPLGRDVGSQRLYRQQNAQR
jgi:hypothetical protein